MFSLPPSLQLAALVDAGQPFSAASVYRWRAQLQRLGLVTLAGRYGNRAGTGLIDAQLQLAAALVGETALTSPTTTPLPLPSPAGGRGVGGAGAPKAPVIVFETMNGAMRALFLRAMAGQPEPGDAAFVAGYLRRNPPPARL